MEGTVKSLSDDGETIVVTVSAEPADVDAEFKPDSLIKIAELGGPILGEVSPFTLIGRNIIECARNLAREIFTLRKQLAEQEPNLAQQQAGLKQVSDAMKALVAGLPRVIGGEEDTKAPD